jgi:hypothetical protein
MDSYLLGRSTINRGHIRTIRSHLLWALITTCFVSAACISQREVDSDEITHTPTSTVPSMFNKTWGITFKSQGAAAKNVKIRYSHAIPTTAQIFLVVNTCFRIVATRVSCTTQRSAATTSEAPRRSRSACEIIESNAMKARPKPTWDQPRSATGLVGDGSMSVLSAIRPSLAGGR